MIVVHCYVRSKPERRAETVAALVAVQRATRALDDGCLHYAYVADLEDECAFTCVEEWRDMEALDSHVRSSHVVAADAVLAQTAEGPEEVRIFRAEPTQMPR